MIRAPSLYSYVHSFSRSCPIGIVYPIMQNRMFESVGFEWTVRAGEQLSFLPPRGAVLIPSRPGQSPS